MNSFADPRPLVQLPVGLPEERPHGRHVYHLFVIRADARGRLAAFLKDAGIQTGIHYPIPVHRQPAVADLRAPALPSTERLVGEILSLPISGSHRPEEIDEVIDAVTRYYAGATLARAVAR
jgi:dTDP-4-amino-4,6-dideoxygalactose transaminase